MKATGLPAQASATDALLVAISAGLAVWLRFRVGDHLQPMLPQKRSATFSGNMVATPASPWT